MPVVEMSTQGMTLIPRKLPGLPGFGILEKKSAEWQIIKCDSLSSQRKKRN